MAHRLRGTAARSQLYAFCVPAAGISYYALRGGSYDIVTRQEEALAVWWLLFLGFALGLLPRSRPGRLPLAVLAAFALLTAWTAASLLWTGSAERTLAEVTRVAHYVGIVALAWSTISRTTWRAAAGGIAAGAFMVVCVAAGSRLAPGVFGKSPVNLGLGTNRLSQPLDYWNAVGAWGTMTLTLGLGWSAHARSTWARAVALAVTPVCALTIYEAYSRAAVAGAVLALIASFVLARNRFVLLIHAAFMALIAANAIAVTRSHEGLAQGTGTAGATGVVAVLAVGAVVAVLVAFATSRARSDERWRLSPERARPVAAGVVTLGVGIALVLLAANSSAISDAWDSFRTPAGPTQESGDPAARLVGLSGKRYQQWAVAVDQFKAQPARGTGAGTYEFAWDRSGHEGFIRDAHSLYLEQMAELGAPGLLLTLAAFFTLLVALVRARIRTRTPLDRGIQGTAAACLIVFLFHAGVDWMWESTAVTVLALGCAATALARGSTDRPRLRFPLRAAAAVAALLMCGLQLPGLVATSEVRRSQDAFRRNDLDAAFAHVNQAVESAPWAATPYVQRGLLDESVGDLDAAFADLGGATARELGNWRHHLLLARLEAERGDVRAAIQEFRRTRELRPASLFAPPQP